MLSLRLRQALIVLIISFNVLCVSAQFGIGTRSQQVDIDGELPEIDNQLLELVQKVTATDPDMDEQTAVDIAAVLQAAKKDPQTVLLLRRLKEGTGKKDFDAYKATVDEIGPGLVQSFQELKMLDILFRDPQRALKLMLEEGMIDKEHLSTYQKNPDLLEEDTRRAVYFTFLSIAAAGDLI
jgi:hypothetical protein